MCRYLSFNFPAEARNTAVLAAKTPLARLPTILFRKKESVFSIVRHFKVLSLRYLGSP